MGLAKLTEAVQVRAKTQRATISRPYLVTHLTSWAGLLTGSLQKASTAPLSTASSMNNSLVEGARGKRGPTWRPQAKAYLVLALHILFSWEGEHHGSGPKGCEGSGTTPLRSHPSPGSAPHLYLFLNTDRSFIRPSSNVHVVTMLFLISLNCEACSSQG